MTDAEITKAYENLIEFISKKGTDGLYWRFGYNCKRKYLLIQYNDFNYIVLTKKAKYYKELFCKEKKLTYPVQKGIYFIEKDIFSLRDFDDKVSEILLSPKIKMNVIVNNNIKIPIINKIVAKITIKIFEAYFIRMIYKKFRLAAKEKKRKEKENFKNRNPNKKSVFRLGRR